MSDQGKSSGDSRKSSGQSQKRQNAPAAENTNSHQRHHKKFSQSSLVPCYVENRRKRPLFSDKKVWIDEQFHGEGRKRPHHHSVLYPSGGNSRDPLNISNIKAGDVVPKVTVRDYPLNIRIPGTKSDPLNLAGVQPEDLSLAAVFENDPIVSPISRKVLQNLSAAKRRRYDVQQKNEKEKNLAKPQLSSEDQKNEEEVKRAEELKKEEEKKKKEQTRKKKEYFNQKYCYGNFDRYYGIRLNVNQKDTRLSMMKKEWFEKRTVLDIGCNVGFLTLSIAKEFEPRRILGIDIDEHLVGVARKNIRHYCDAQLPMVGKFPASFSAQFGPISQQPLSFSTKFPDNVWFRCENYVMENEALLELVEAEYDVILALSVSKWIHLNWGDDGMRFFFRRVFANLLPGGRFIFEPQPFQSYSKRAKMTKILQENYKKIEFRPEDFEMYLLEECGFESVTHLGVPEANSKATTLKAVSSKIDQPQRYGSIRPRIIQRRRKEPAPSHDNDDDALASEPGEGRAGDSASSSHPPRASSPADDLELEESGVYVHGGVMRINKQGQNEGVPHYYEYTRRITVEDTMGSTVERDSPFIVQALPGEANTIESYPCRFCSDRVFLTPCGLEKHAKSMHFDMLPEVQRQIRIIEEEWKRRYAELNRVSLRKTATRSRLEQLAAAAAREMRRDSERLHDGGYQVTEEETEMTGEGSSDVDRVSDGSFEVCSICNVYINITHPTAYDTHMRAHKKNEELREYLLQNHGAEHMARLTCSECHIVFPEEKKLHLHNERMHKRTKKYVCKWCGHISLTISGLNEHKMDVHALPSWGQKNSAYNQRLKDNRLKRSVLSRRNENARAHAAFYGDNYLCRANCPKCGLTLTRPSLLIRHMLRVHSLMTFSAVIETRGMPPFVAHVERGRVTWTCCNQTHPDSISFGMHRRREHYPRMGEMFSDSSAERIVNLHKEPALELEIEPGEDVSAEAEEERPEEEDEAGHEMMASSSHPAPYQGQQLIELSLPEGLRDEGGVYMLLVEDDGAGGQKRSVVMLESTHEDMLSEHVVVGDLDDEGGGVKLLALDEHHQPEEYEEELLDDQMLLYVNNEGEVLEDMRGQDEEDQDCKPTRRELNTVVPDEHSVSRIEVPHDYCGEEYQEFKPKVDELTSKGRAHNGEKSTSKGPETAALAEVSNEEDAHD